MTTTTTETTGIQKMPATLRARAVELTLITLAGLTLSGCVATAGPGYTTAYYTPDYAPFYGDYGYDGSPYWGAGPYIGNSIIISGRSHHRYYGGHHFYRDGRGAGYRRGASFHRGGGVRAGGDRGHR